MKAFLLSLCLGSTVFLGLLLPLQADLLVYEGFNYVLADNSSMSGVTSTATGLTGTYSVSNTGSAVTYFNNSGLSFGSNFLSTSGGALNQRSINAGTTFTGAALNTASVSGDLWSSYLFNYAEISGAINTTGQVRLNTSNTGSSSTDWFSVASDVTTSTQSPQISYNGSTTTSTYFGYSANTTYLLLSKFTNVGSTLSVGTPGAASLWIFTQANYDNWVTAGSVEAQLSTYANGTATTSATSGTYDFSGSLQYVFYNGNASNVSSLFIDEVRYGTTLGDVVAVPEPSTYFLLMGGISLLTLLRLRRS